MIRVNNGTIEMKGRAITLMGDFTMITHSLLNAFTKKGSDKDKVVEDLTVAFNLGLKDEKEIHKEAMKAVVEFMNRIINSEEDEENE